MLCVMLHVMLLQATAGLDLKAITRLLQVQKLKGGGVQARVRGEGGGER